MQQTLEPALLLVSFVNHANASTRCINKESYHEADVMYGHTQCAIHHPLKQNIAQVKPCSSLHYPLFYQLSIILPNNTHWPMAMPMPLPIAHYSV